MVRKDRIDMTGALVMVSLSALFGVNQVMIKVVNTGLQPIFQAGLRSLFAFVFILLVALVMRKKLSLTDGSFWPGVLAGLFFATEFALVFWALDYTSVSRVSIFFNTMPFWTALGAHFLIPGDRLSPIKLLGLVLAMIGVVWALADRSDQISENAIWGDLMGLIAATFWAGILLLARTTKLAQSSPEMQLLYQLAVSAMILIPLSMLFADQFGGLVRDYRPLVGWLLAAQVILVAGIGFLVWFWVLSIYPASNMASFGFLSPVFGVILGWLLLSEPISVSVVGALVLVALGIMLINRQVRS